MARFVLSHRLAGKKTKDARLESHQAFLNAHAKFRAVAKIAGGGRHTADSRGLFLLDGDARDLESKRRELPAGVVLESETFRKTARFWPASHAVSRRGSAADGSAGIGSRLEFTLRSEDKPLVGARVNAVMTNLRDGSSISLTAVTDQDGHVAFAYSPRNYYAAAATVMPRSSVWSWFVANPQTEVTQSLPSLPMLGPLGWWHRALGTVQPGAKRGQGIRIGVIDTGAGPHPFLKHLHSAGAYVNGALDPSSSAVRDVSDHGTHVSGIIAARPSSGSGAYEGIAPGAEVFVARVCAEAGDDEADASSADIAAAIDALALTHAVDLINISLAGPEASEIEADAIHSALEAGVLVICAAGNENGMSVMYPAAAPGAIAVSAVGLTGTFPASSVDQFTIPRQANRFAAGGFYSASFNCVGSQIACAAPGVGIISTVPGSSPSDPAYAAMSGTSMASPAVCAALATLLSEDPQYQKMPRDITRAQYAWAVLCRSMRWFGLSTQLAGMGLASARP